MTIYEELEQMVKKNAAMSCASQETTDKLYYAGMCNAFRTVLDLFDKRERPKVRLYEITHGIKLPYYCIDDVADFLPPERK